MLTADRFVTAVLTVVPATPRWAVRNVVSEQNVERAQPPEPVRECACEVRRVPTVCVECGGDRGIGRRWTRPFSRPHVRLMIGIHSHHLPIGLAESSGLVQSIDA